MHGVIILALFNEQVPDEVVSLIKGGLNTLEALNLEHIDEEGVPQTEPTRFLKIEIEKELDQLADDFKTIHQFIYPFVDDISQQVYRGEDV